MDSELKNGGRLQVHVGAVWVCDVPSPYYLAAPATIVLEGEDELRAVIAACAAALELLAKQ